MNKKYLYLSVLFLGLIACGSPEPHEEEITQHVEEVEAIDSNVVEEVVEDLNENKPAFNFFEDYASVLTKTDLIAQFGEDNLEHGVSWYAEGTVQMNHTVLTNPDNGHIVKYVWDEDGEHLSSIEASYYKWDENFEIHGTQTISSENGLTLGMSLADLKDWNGADFRFSGFGWDYAGGVFPEAGSKLADSKVKVTLINDQEKSNEGFDFMIGDIELNTSEDRLKDAPVLVEQFSLYVDDYNGE